MNQTYVSLDLETTGLNPDSDRIIEVGMVKFCGEEVIDTFHTLVNPYCPLPYRIRLLTGITPEEVKAAPPFPAVAPEIISFVGDYPIVGQNIKFDLDFLSSQGVEFLNPIYDTLKIAHILLPSLPDHRLPTLAEQLVIPYPVQHRALADAITAKEVFLALLDKASQLPLSLMIEINRSTAATHWSWRSLFLDIERAKAGTHSLWDWGKETQRRSFALSTYSGQKEPLIPRSTPEPLDLNQLTTLLEPDSPIATSFPAFEHRSGQVSMMQAVAQALSDRQHLIVEAGTGIGKSIAYLLPAILFSLRNNAHIIISTNTINLQEQLMNKDIPDLLQALQGLEVISDLRVTQLKGRSNYLCLRRWNSWRDTPGLPWEEIEFLLRTLVWLSSSPTGDRAELNLTRNESTLWNRICASEDNCIQEQCPYYKDGCFLYRARHKAEEAHLIVVNHALLLSDMVKGRILPEYSHLVIDEAHHLEEEATQQLGYQISRHDIFDYLDRLDGRDRALLRLQDSLHGSLSALRRKEIDQAVESLGERVKVARSSVSQFFDILAYFLHLYAEGQGNELRFNTQLRRRSEWAQIEIPWENLSLRIEEIENKISELHAMLENLRGDSNPDSLMMELSLLQQRGSGLRRQLNSVMASSEANNICWVSQRGQDDDLYLHTAPLHVGKALEEQLFWQKDSIVLTSATLSTEGTFDYVKERLELREANELIIDTPFDYMTSAMIYLPQDIPEPDEPGYQQAVEQSLLELGRATQGRTLALFTSHAALRATHTAIQARLEEEGILVLGQGIDGSPKQLLTTFKNNPRTMLLGTASLWEGIDVVGKPLSVLVIARLPFSVPTDPIFSARCELYNDPFNQYALPQAALRFKQGFGRLIRSKEDKGVMVVLDRRLQTKPYGRVFLASLPRCTIRSGRLRQMPQEVTGWLEDLTP